MKGADWRFKHQYNQSNLNITENITKLLVPVEYYNF